MIKCISQETLKESLIPYLQKNYHTLKEHGVVYKKDESCAEITDVETVVIAIGVRANTVLEESLTDCDFTIVSVGDCHERAKNGYRGIQEGYEAGILI